MGKNYYQILGVARNADAAALKKAYRKQAMKWHPDKHSSESEAKKAQAEEKFKDVAEAFEVLNDPDKRAVFDRYGEEGLKPGGGSSSGYAPSGSDGYSTQSYSSSGMDTMRANQMFDSFFGNGATQGASTGGSGISLGTDKLGINIAGTGFNFSGNGAGISLFGKPIGVNFGGSPQKQTSAQSGASSSAGGNTSGAANNSTATPAVDGPLPAGTRVKLEGLTSGSEHNGSVGRVERFDAAAQRYHVRLAGDHGNSSIAVRLDNLRQVISSAKVVGCQTQPQLNGRVPAAVTYDRQSQRYRAEGLSENGATLALKPENLVLPAATQVTIDGVVSRPALNGKRGLIVDVEEERYVVQTGDGEKLRLKFGTVVAV